eukprot:scaffold152400_cov16-Tisochrysis_lutea.AAC.2
MVCSCANVKKHEGILKLLWVSHARGALPFRHKPHNLTLGGSTEDGQRGCLQSMDRRCLEQFISTHCHAHDIKRRYNSKQTLRQ